MPREAVSGALLVTGALAGVLVMGLHPTGTDLLTHQDSARVAHLNATVHGLALATGPVLFLGLLGVARRLGFSDLAVAGLVAYGFALVALIPAAVASGFVATDLTGQILAADTASRELYHSLLAYTGLLNRGFARVYVAGCSASTLLWSVAILRSRRMSRAAGSAGVAIGVAVLFAVFSGHLRLDVHGFGMVTLLQSGWLIWIGLLMLGSSAKREGAAE